MIGNDSIEGDLHVAAVVKGSERYVFLWHPSQLEAMLRIAWRWARDPRLSLTFYDVVLLEHKTRTGGPSQ